MHLGGRAHPSRYGRDIPLGSATRSRTRNRRARVLAVGLSLIGATFVGPTAITTPPPAEATSSVSPGPLAEGDVIYQVLVDRFKDGDPTNNDQGAGEYDPR